MARRPPLRFRHVLMALVPVVVLVALAEAALWTFAGDRRVPVYFRMEQSGEAPLEVLLPEQPEDPDLFWVFDPEVLDRSLEQIAAYRGPNLVVTFGGSIAAGEGPRTFSRFALELATAAGYRLAGFNLAYGGYTSHRSRVLLDRVLAGGKAPDVAIVCNAANDIRAAQRDDRTQQALNHRPARQIMHQLNRMRLFARFRLLLLAATRSRSARPQSFPTVCVPLGHYEDNLEHLARRTAEAGSALILVSQPMALSGTTSALAPYFAVGEKVAANHPHVYFVDVRPRFAELRRELGIPFCNEAPDGERRSIRDTDGPACADLLFSDAIGHQTEFGMRRTAEVIFAALEENGLLAR